MSNSFKQIHDAVLAYDGDLVKRLVSQALQEGADPIEIMHNGLSAAILEVGDRFGREEIFRWIRDNLYNQAQKNVLVLHGGWHTGKTSILYQLQGGPLGRRLRERRQRPVFPVFIDLQGMPDPGTDLFLLGVAESVGYVLRERDVACPSPVEADFRKAPYRAFDTFLKDVDQLLMQRAQGLLVIMLDEFELLDDRVKQARLMSKSLAI